jgi:hypothetical protein
MQHTLPRQSSHALTTTDPEHERQNPQHNQTLPPLKIKPKEIQAARVERRWCCLVNLYDFAVGGDGGPPLSSSHDGWCWMVDA